MTASCARNGNVVSFTTPAHRRIYRRGLKDGQRLGAQASNRVQWTVRPAIADAMMLGVAIGLVIGVAIRPLPIRDLPLLALALTTIAVGAALAARIILRRKP